MQSYIGRDVVRIKEKYSRGRRGAPAKGVGRVTGARVQIPLSPLKKGNLEEFQGFLFWKSGHRLAIVIYRLHRKKENDLKKDKQEVLDLALENEELSKEMKLLKKKGLGATEYRIAYDKAKDKKNENLNKIVSIMKENDFKQGVGEGKYIANNLESILNVFNSELDEINKKYIEVGEANLELEKKTR